MTNTSPPNTNSDSHSPTSQKRQRAKQACEPCRLRKRRCDGDLPCNMCVKFEYKCYFEKHSRKRSKIVERDAVENGIVSPPSSAKRDSTIELPASMRDQVPEAEHAAPEEMYKLRSMEANSGMAFTRFLGMRLDASAGPKLLTFGWNLGSMPTTQPVVGPVTAFLTLDQMLAMAKLYFENVHPLYGFLDRDWIMARIVERYGQGSQLQQCPDHLLQGIAVLASLFADGAIDNVIQSLVEAAKLSLEATSTTDPPTLTDVQSWLLRVIYLRFCGNPHSCWMASCTTIHLIECLGLHQESSNTIMYPQTREQKLDEEIRRRTFWVARLLNSWVSFEYGRSRITLRGITCPLPEARPNDFTREYVLLYSLSCCLDPEVLDKPDQWEDVLKQLEAYEARHECIALSKANLGLCVYRRLRLSNPNLQADTINRIIGLAQGGLEAARTMATRHKPWWHVANVPFQCICVLLAIDSKESLSHLAQAMRTLEFVVEAFPSTCMKEALKTSRFLVRLSKRKKDQDSDVLAQSLLKDGCDPQPENVQKQPDAEQPDGATQAPPVSVEEDPLTTSSGEDWNLDYLNNPQFDWNFFLAQDIPAFQHLAPDGQM